MRQCPQCQKKLSKNMLLCPRCGFSTLQNSAGFASTADPSRIDTRPLANTVFDEELPPRDRAVNRRSSMIPEAVPLIGGEAGKVARKTSKSGCTCAALVIAAVMVVLGVTLVSAMQHGPGSGPSLVLNGRPVSGQQMALHGDHFSPNSQVSITIDGEAPAVASHSVLQHAARSMYNGYTSFFLFSTIRSNNYQASNTIEVRSDGTFDVTFIVKSIWQVGSTHTLQILDQSGQLLAQANFTIQPPDNSSSYTPSSTPTNTPTPTPILTPTNTPTPTPTSTDCLSIDTSQITLNANAGDSNAQTQAVTITNCGSTTASWSASISDGAANWLSIDQNNGSLDSGEQTQVQISASAAALSANQYTGYVTFTLGTAQSQGVGVTFNVQQPPPPTLAVDKTQLDSTCTQGSRDTSASGYASVIPVIIADASPTIKYCTITLSEQGSGDLHWEGSTDAAHISWLSDHSDHYSKLSAGDLSTVQPTQQIDIAVYSDSCRSSKQIIFTFTGTASDGTQSQQTVTFTC